MYSFVRYVKGNIVVPSPEAECFVLSYSEIKGWKNYIGILVKESYSLRVCFPKSIINHEFDRLVSVAIKAYVKRWLFQLHYHINYFCTNNVIRRQIKDARKYSKLAIINFKKIFCL